MPVWKTWSSPLCYGGGFVLVGVSAVFLVLGERPRWRIVGHEDRGPISYLGSTTVRLATHAIPRSERVDDPEESSSRTTTDHLLQLLQFIRLTKKCLLCSSRTVDEFEEPEELSEELCRTGVSTQSEALKEREEAFPPGPIRANTAPHSAVEACSEGASEEISDELSCKGAATWAATGQQAHGGVENRRFSWPLARCFREAIARVDTLEMYLARTCLCTKKNSQLHT